MLKKIMMRSTSSAISAIKEEMITRSLKIREQLDTKLKVHKIPLESLRKFSYNEKLILSERKDKNFKFRKN